MDFSIEVCTPDNPLTNEVCKLFSATANEKGWDVKDFSTYHWERSIYVVMLAEEEVVGAVQLVTSAPFPIQEVWSQLDFPDQSKVVELALLALSPKYRNRKAQHLLTAKMWHECQRRGFTHLCAEVPEKLWKIYLRMGWPFHPLGETRVHWGERCIPGIICLTEVGQLQQHQEVVAKTQ